MSRKEIIRCFASNHPVKIIALLIIFIFYLSFFNLLISQTPNLRKGTASQSAKQSSQEVGSKKNLNKGKTSANQPAANPKQSQPPATVKGIPESTLKILKENRFLEEELKLAKNPQYYFVLNLKEKKIELRARGMVLKSWKASELRYSGKPVPLKVTTLNNKTALNPPERKMIRPGEEQSQEAKKAAEKAKQEERKKDQKKKDQSQPAAGTTDNFEVEALEITDMPGSYELLFDDGLKILIRSRSGMKESFRQTREKLVWHTWYPIKHFLFRQSELRPIMIIYFDNPRDAQGIYWAFINGLKGIIWFP
ncbi:MAG: hypothetical protein ACPLRA_00955 [Candidatus Saccharicenans sp.]